MKKHSYYYKFLLFFVFSFVLYSYLKSSTIIEDELFSDQIFNVDENKLHIFILAGQSNMAGRGGVTNHMWDEYVPLECSPDPYIRILSLNENNLLQQAKEPLHAGIDNKTCGVGPGMAFANAILRRDPDFGTMILVPCAVGGTSIQEWSSHNSSLRRRTIERTREAIMYGGKLRAILWYQGEKDTETEEAMRVYPSEYETFIHRLHEELGRPRVPFIQVALASGQGEPSWLERVRATQLAMTNMITVDAMGLPLQPDGLHLTTEAQVRLGNMLADAFLGITVHK